MEQLCVNCNNSAIIDSSATNYASYESLRSQLCDDVFHMQSRLRDNLLWQNDCHIIGTFQRFIAGMTSQIRLLWLISSRGYLHWLMPCQRIGD